MVRVTRAQSDAVYKAEPKLRSVMTRDAFRQYTKRDKDTVPVLLELGELVVNWKDTPAVLRFLRRSHGRKQKH